MSPSFQISGNLWRYWLFVGLFSTFAMDLWGVVLSLLLGDELPNYHVIGRYLLSVLDGDSEFPNWHIARDQSRPWENLLGWCFHACVGLTDTLLFMWIVRRFFHGRVALWFCLIFTWILMIMPLAIAQPALGLGYAGSLSPDPTLTRLKTLSFHTIFGVCLYLGTGIFAWMNRRK